MGIEPTAPAWEAGVLPLYDARKSAHSNAFLMKHQIFRNQNNVQASTIRPKSDISACR